MVERTDPVRRSLRYEWLVRDKAGCHGRKVRTAVAPANREGTDDVALPAQLTSLLGSGRLL